MKIKVNKLRLFGHHGIYDKEKNDGQDFEINITVKIKRPKTKNDELESTVDYTEIMNKVVSVFNSRRYNLLEALMDDMLLAILSDNHIKTAEISIKKINPPIDLEFESIEIKDKRKNG